MRDIHVNCQVRHLRDPYRAANKEDDNDKPARPDGPAVLFQFGFTNFCPLGWMLKIRGR